MGNMSEQNRYWVRFISMWSGKKTIHSFDTFKEAEWYAKQVSGEIYDYHYNVIANYGYKEI